MSAAFDRMATQEYSTERSPAFSGAKRGAKATNILSIFGLPVTPLDPEIAERINIETPFELWETFFSGVPDIAEGDYLVRKSDSQEFSIKAVGDWPWSDGTEFKHLILEEVKK